MNTPVLKKGANYLGISLALLTLTAASASAAVDFQRDILPIFEKSCFECHSSVLKKPKGGVLLDTAAALKALETDIGWKAVLDLVKLPKGHDDLMPPEDKGGPLSAPHIALLETWIKEGAALGGFVAHQHEKQRQTSGLGARKIATDIPTAAAEIDRLIDADLQRKKLPRTAAITDATFLRRAYLDLAGRNPSVAEAETFLGDTAADKRSRLLRSLADSPAYVSHHFNYWAKVLRAESDQAGNQQDAWLHYLKTTLAANVPYDEWTRDMLMAEGHLWDDPAIGFYLRDQKNRLAGYEAMTSVFLGTDIGCAQCHDHPARPVSQLSYFKMLGYYQATHPFGNAANIFENMPKGEFMASYRERQAEVKKNRANLKDRQRRVLDLGFMSTYDFRSRITAEADTQRSKVPSAYRYEDVKKGQHLPPETLFGHTPALPPGEKPMHVFTRWITDSQNLRFTHVIANRMWLKIIGAPVLGPPTDILPHEQSANPALAQHLAELMLACRYDLKHFQLILMSTRSYQSESMPEEAIAKDYAFQAPIYRRLSAELIWDSFITMIRDQPDPPMNTPAPDFSFYRAAIKAPSAEAYWQLVEQRLDYELEHKVGRIGSFSTAAKSKVIIGRQGYDAASLLRASALPSPTPAGHFLQIFGQGQRSIIEDQWATATIPQALTLLNGTLHDEIAHTDSALSRSLGNMSDADATLRRIYLATLSRYPSAQELALAREITASRSRGSYLRLLWLLMNTTEYLLQP